MSNRIDMKGIGKSFFATRALDNVSFTCMAGEVHALVGLNGAGKSTVMKVLGGVYQMDKGVIEKNGQPIEVAVPADVGKARVSMIHQELSFINDLTVAKSIFLGRELKRGVTPFSDKREMARQVKQQLDRFGLTLDPNKPVRELNSGEKQIVEIIRALMSNSWLIVMDEPTSALPEEDKDRLFEFIRRMKVEGIAIIYISHHMPEIFGIAEQVTVMRDGVIVLSERTAGTTEDHVIKSMTGEELEHFVKPHKEISGMAILSVDNLCKPGAYDNISLEVRPGEIVVMTGLRGCGAPELAKAIFGLDSDYDGSVTYRAKVLKPGRGPAVAVCQGMGLVTENRDKNGIFPPLSVRDNIALPFLDKAVRGGILDADHIDNVVAKAIRDTSTKTSSSDQEIRLLSGGNKQKICFSRWLDEDLELLILLEPTRSIDVHAKADIYRIIEDLAERGVGILILSYEIYEVIMLADRVLTMYQGQSVSEYFYPNFE